MKVIIGILFIVYLLFTSSILLKNSAQNIKLIYFPDVPVIYILIVIVTAITIVNRLGFNTVLKCNLIIVPLILITLAIIFLLSTSSFTVERLLPVLGYGANETFVLGLTNIFAFSGILYLYFVMPLLKTKETFKKVSITSIAICAIFLLLAISCLLLVFPLATVSEELMPIYLLTREESVGKLIYGADIEFILIWIFAASSYLSISIAFILRIFQKITGISNTKPIVYCFTRNIVWTCSNSWEFDTNTILGRCDL